jgi:hypothetical protein
MLHIAKSFNSHLIFLVAYLTSNNFFNNFNLEKVSTFVRTNYLLYINMYIHLISSWPKPHGPMGIAPATLPLGTGLRETLASSPPTVTSLPEGGL